MRLFIIEKILSSISSPMSSSRAQYLVLLASLLALTFVANSQLVHADVDVDDIDITKISSEQDDTSTDGTSKAEINVKDKSYISPRIKKEGVYLFETFDDETQFNTNWVQSSDEKYQGKWKLDSGPDRPRADLQLLLPLKARHYAVSSKLSEPFKFSDDKPLVVQYEVQFREGLDCGGAYVKLLRQSAITDLRKLTDKTPFSIMFGPDKCGSEAKLHFIIQYLNPTTHEYAEQHWKQSKVVSNLMSVFSDKKHHLFKLVLEPSNDFEIFLDEKSVGKGNLLEDLDPSINPPKEIVDPNDTKPADWDERPQIEDTEAKKPEDWDEDAPKTIEDPSASKPSDWLEEEPKYIPDPEAKKPEDWEEMDGDWEAPLIENPKCAEASGCGEWKAPTIPNPNYKGKWKAPKIDNPNYKGKWTARMIPNPNYFYDESPFKSLDSIGGIAYELWSMADNVAFDNLIITNNPEAASLLQILTWQEKKAEADASSPSLLTRATHYLKVYPWLWAVLVLAVALPLFLFISYCCDTKRRQNRASGTSSQDSARRKKEDEPKPDDEAKLDEEEIEDEETGEEGIDEEDGDEADVEADEKEAGDKVAKKAVRQRKKN